MDVDDGRPFAALVLHPIDTTTGEPLADYQVYFHPAGNVEAQESGSAAEPWTRDVSEGVAFAWRVHASGYRPVSGDESAFADDAELTVALELGFSAVINLNSIESLRSLEGVEVFVDGVSVGWTDADGFPYFDLPSRPARISLDSTLWTVYTDETRR